MLRAKPWQKLGDTWSEPPAISQLKDTEFDECCWASEAWEAWQLWGKTCERESYRMDLGGAGF